MDALFIGVITGIVSCLIAYKYIKLKQNINIDNPSKGGSTGGSSETPVDEK